MQWINAKQVKYTRLFIVNHICQEFTKKSVQERKHDRDAYSRIVVLLKEEKSNSGER